MQVLWDASMLSMNETFIEPSQWVKHSPREKGTIFNNVRTFRSLIKTLHRYYEEQLRLDEA